MAAEQRFLTFHSSALAEDQLLVTSFRGRQELSRPYRFEIDLVAHANDLDLREVLKNSAWLGIKQALKLADSGRGLFTRKLHGVVNSIEQVGEINDMTQYRVELVPKIWKLRLTHQSRIFLDSSIGEIIEQVLAGHGFGSDDFELRLSSREYPVRDYIVQYEEPDLDFLSRWLEYEGIYYFFEQTDGGEKVVFADSTSAYPAIAEDMSIPYRPQVGDDGSRTEVGDSDSQDWFKEEVLQSMKSRITTIPREVTLNDYDWQRPTQNLKVTRTIHEDGEGTVYEYNNHYRNPEAEGADLARIRAEAILCREHAVSGGSDCRAFRPGCRFEITGHPRSDFNATFVLTAVDQHGTQAIGLAGSGAMGATYGNTFTAIPAARVFRPARITPWPSIKGVMNAHIDGPDGSKTAQIDGLGRYKVKLPLDLSDAREGKASRFVRMAQPYSGAEYGMHFPLHVGTEVLLIHVDGDPDRPVIIGSVPNAETKSPVTSKKPERNVIRTASGCVIEFKDSHL